jgi:hypothetical protein
LFKLKSSLAVWQTHYCNGEYGSCARHRLAEGGARVPPNLLPNGKSLEIVVPLP